MTKRIRAFVRILGPVLLLLALLVFPAHGAAAAPADPTLIRLDGYLQFTEQGRDGGYRCLIIRQHDGSLYALSGGVLGLINGDHVRLEGRAAPDRCGARGFAVTDVQTVWADDNHKTTYYDHLKDGRFHDWAEHNNRIHGDEHGYRH